MQGRQTSRGRGNSILQLFYSSLTSLQQAVTCGSNFHAINEAHTKYSAGYAVTGVAGVDCARHGFKRPLGVVDLQKGERYVAISVPYRSTDAHGQPATSTWTSRSYPHFDSLSSPESNAPLCPMTLDANGPRTSRSASSSTQPHPSSLRTSHTGALSSPSFTSLVMGRPVN